MRPRPDCRPATHLTVPILTPQAWCPHPLQRASHVLVHPQGDSPAQVPSQTQALASASVGPAASLSSLAFTSFTQEKVHDMRSLPIHHDVFLLSLNLTFKACAPGSLFCQAGLLTAHMLTAERLQRTKRGASREDRV